MALLLALAVGCDGTSNDDAGPGPTLELGTGEGRYSTFEDGETLDLVTGCQGAQHVWIALRTTGLERRGVIIDTALRRVRDDVEVSTPLIVRVTLDDAGGEIGEIAGLTLVVPEPDEALEEDLRLSATVTDQDDLSASDVRPVRIAWADGGCL